MIWMELVWKGFATRRARFFVIRKSKRQSLHKSGLLKVAPISLYVAVFEIRSWIASVHRTPLWVGRVIGVCAAFFWCSCGITLFDMEDIETRSRGSLPTRKIAKKS